jgi:hypothetical protein
LTEEQDKILLSWDETEGIETTEAKFFIDHYIPQEGIVLLYGKYGTYKTPLTVNLAKAIATGQEFLGLETKQASPLLYVELDSPKQVILPRLKQIGLKGVPADFAFCFPGFDCVRPNSSPWNSEVYATLSAAHREKKYRVVFIDALRGVHNLPAEASETPHQVYRALSLLFPGAVILVIHHDRKTKFERGIGIDAQEEMEAESFSGSQAWINHATVALKIAHHNKRHRQIVLSHVKSQASELQPPLMVQVQDGAGFSSVSHITNEGVQTALNQISISATAREKDRAIAEYFGVSERTARNHRLEYDAAQKTEK